MKKIVAVLLLLLGLLALAACSEKDTIEVESVVIRKEVLDGDQYYIYVEYPLPGMEGLFEASIKVRNRAEYNRYEVGDTYRLRRPAPKR